MSYFCLNLGQTAENSDMFTNIWLSSRGLKYFFTMKIGFGNIQWRSASLGGGGIKFKKMLGSYMNHDNN